MFHRVLLLFFLLPLTTLSPYWKLYLPHNFTHSTPFLWEGKAVLVGTSKIFLLDFEKKKLSFKKFPGTRLMGENLAGNLLIVPTLHDFLHCFDLKRKEFAWSIKLRDSFLAPPLIRGNYIYLPSAQGFLYKISLTSGKILMKKKLSGPFYSSPAFKGDILYIGNIRGKAYGISLDGKGVCTFSRFWPGSFYILSFQNHLALTAGRELFFVGRRCRIKSRVKFRDRIIAPPVSFGNSLIVAAGKEVLRINEKGRVLWKFKTRAEVVAKPEIEAPFIFVMDSSGLLYKLNSEGKLIRTFSAGGPSYSPPLLTQKFLLILTVHGEVSVFKR